MAAAKTTVEIDTWRTVPNEIQSLPRVSRVTADDPWDSLSKAFKKYTHTIDYSKAGSSRDGNPSDYSIKLVSSGGSNNTFTLNSLERWVEEVEVYFKGTASPGSTAPLIVGFVYATSDRTGCNSNKCYYTWNYLKGSGNNVKTGTVGTEAVIKEQDLVIRLLEELGRTSMPSRQNKLVIRLDERPNGVGGGRTKYPESGHYQTRQITVSKAPGSSDLPGYVGFEHTAPNGGFTELYVSYHNNSLFFKTGSGHKISKVTAYYEDDTNRVSSNEKKLVLITFTVTYGSEYVYKFFDFVNDLKKVRSWASYEKTIVGFGGSEALPMVGHGGSALKTRLPQETERLRPLIAFQNDNSGLKNNENIITKESIVGSGYSFKMVTMKPDTSDKGAGFPVGPWYVYNTKLFTGHEDGMKIQPEPLLSGFYTGNTANGNSKKYNNITVYYYVTTGSSNTGGKKALLVVFDQARTGDSIRGSGSGSSDGGGKKYFKRKNKEGTEWATETISGKVDEGVLNKIGKAAGIIEDSNLAATIGGSIAGVGGVGGIAGIAIYKYPQLFLSLIGR